MDLSWIDRREYPFQSHYFQTPAGKMHYVDEGDSDHALIMVHGNPVWSFAYRHLVKALSPHYRCIAVDHLGFGLSDKPVNGFDYYPESHARNLELLLDSLNLRRMTFMVEDWGGPIGLSYAIKHPEKIASNVIMNTFLWSAKGDPHYEMFSGIMGSFFGRFLITRLNFFARVMVKQAFGDKSRLTRHVHQHYINALPTPQDRIGCSVFPKRIIGSSDWLASLWQQRHKIADIPALVLWGEKDIAFRQKELNVWKDTLTRASFKQYPDVGHFVHEELGADMGPLVKDFVGRHNAKLAA